MQYIDNMQTKDEQQGTWQPNHTSTTEWQNTSNVLLTVTTFNGFEVRLGVAAKETHCNRTMAISTFKYTYRSKSPGTASKVKLHATPRTRLEHCYSLNQPNQHSSQPIRNHNTISRNDRDNNSSSKPEKRICSQLLKNDSIIQSSTTIEHWRTKTL